MSKKFLLLPSLVLILGVTAFVLWRMDKTSTPVVAPEPVVNNSESNIQSDLDRYPQHIENIPNSTDEVWYNIPELGVRMKLNKDFAGDLIYSVSHIKKTYGEKEEVDIAYFSTKSMMHIDAFCAPDKGASGGAVSRNKGVAKEVAKSDEYIAARLNNLIQIDGFYYIYTKPQATCWDSNLTKEVLKFDPMIIYKGLGHKSLDNGFRGIELIIEGE